ncbi:hypothetical protein [Pedobacter agri]|uniref:hypothetical protein n=1 Tax=Pedobacter agri TaxID=454586 RepID=UPI00292EA4B8|nr:hypothetical protein [Pedobacter agri]
MKALTFLFCLLWLPRTIIAQRAIHDQAIINQQERMVFKSWDADKFTPKPGFLGLNPMYWITWGLHPNYPDTDLRPLGPAGPQTLRLGLIAAMKSSEDAYKLHADTVRNTALSNYTAYSAALSGADPLWHIYYRSALSPLDNLPQIPLGSLTLAQRKYLSETGMISWYTQQHQALAERLHLARTTHMERGSRILLYHRLLLEYRKLQAAWEDKIRRSKTYLNLSVQRQKIKERSKGFKDQRLSDIAIADKVLKNSKL